MMIKQEHPAVFAERFTRSYRLLHFIAYRVLGDSDYVRLAIQKCRRTASRNPPHFQYEGAFRSWLVRVLIDEALVILRESQAARKMALFAGQLPVRGLNTNGRDEDGTDRSVLYGV